MEFEWYRYFKEHGWPSSSIFEKPPEDDAARAKLIDTIQVGRLEVYISLGKKIDTEDSLLIGHVGMTSRTLDKQNNGRVLTYE